MQKLPYFLLGGGFLLCALSAVVGWILVPLWIHNSLNEEGNLRKLSQDSKSAKLTDGSGGGLVENDNEIWKEWNGEEPTVDIYKKLYLFNVNNPEEIKNGTKPILNEVGPFVYRMVREKTNIHPNQGNHTIFYNEKVFYYFEPDLSTGTEDDFVTAINIPFVGLTREISKMSPLIRYMVTSFIDKFKEDVFVTKTVREMLFGGYHQEMVAALSRITLQEYLQNDTFGIYYGFNGTDAGRYEIDSGIPNQSRYGQAVSWNWKNEFNEWKVEEQEENNVNCHEIVDGTDDYTFPPHLTKNSVLKILKHSMCRVFPLEFSEESSINGIPSFRYVMPSRVFQDPRKNKDNMCYCTLHTGDYEECPSDGAVQIGACRLDAPVYISMPHFLYGPSYASQCEGYKPDPEKHQAFVEVEPNTGLVLRAGVRIQVSLELMPHAFNKGLQRVPHVLIPFLWEEDTITQSPAAGAKLHRMIGTTTFAAQLGSSIGIGIGVLIIVIALVIFILRYRKRTYAEGE